MKHLLNDMSSEEKKSILEQHKGGIKIDNTIFKFLLESKLGDSKPLINESEELVIVADTEIAPEDASCFVDATEQDLTLTGLSNKPKKPKYKTKKKGCMTKTKYKGVKVKYRP